MTCFRTADRLGDLSFWHIAANYRKGGSYKSFLSPFSITHFVICDGVS